MNLVAKLREVSSTFFGFLGDVQQPIRWHGFALPEFAVVLACSFRRHHKLFLCLGVPF